MPTNAFDIKEVFTSAWEGFTKNVVLLVVLALASLVVPFVFYGFLMLFTIVLPIFIFLFPIFILIEIVLTFYILFCIVKASLAVSKGETVSWEILKTDFIPPLKFFIVFLIMGIATGIVSTVITFIFPLILGVNAASMFIITVLMLAITIGVMTFFFPAQFMIIDKPNVSIIDVFTKSWNMTFPQAVQCLIFIFICCALVLIGMIPLGLGLLVVIPVVYIAGAIVYKKLDAAAIAAAEKPAETASGS
ncbi:MAG: hypothetical protein FWG57_02900 [Endomicrobia bacterium]|nr:hypothetical protein [Endomicrobiia bacterium]